MKINGVKVLFESQNIPRTIVRNPLDFLQTHHIQNGHFISMGYLEDSELAINRRQNIAVNDPALAEFIKKSPNSNFGRDFAGVRNSEKYKAAMLANKSGTFELVGVHLVKCGKYNFQWKNQAARLDTYTNKALPAEQAIRKLHGFSETGNESDFSAGDWHIKHKFDKKGNDMGFAYGGPGVLTRVDDRHKNAGVGWIPIGGDDADFYEHENTHNISFRQILNKANAQATTYKYFYVKESDGHLEPLDQEAYYLLSKAYSTKAVESAGEELVEQEQAFLADMNELGERFEHRNFVWDKILYFTGSTAGKDAETGKRIYEPFIWINDEQVVKMFPWLNVNDLAELIDSAVRIAQDELDNWRATPAVWESKNNRYKRTLNEAIDQDMADNLYDNIEEVLSEMYNDADIEYDSELQDAIFQLEKLSQGRNPRLLREILDRLSISMEDIDSVRDVIEEAAEIHIQYLRDNCSVITDAEGDDAEDIWEL